MAIGAEIDGRDESLLAEIRAMLNTHETADVTRRTQLLAELLAPYRPVLRGLVASRLWRLGPEAVEEGIQHAWLRLVEEILSGKTWDVPFRIIVIGTAGFASGDTWKDKMRRQRRTVLSPDPSSTANDLALEDGVLESIMVSDFIKTLSERDAEIAKLCWEEGYTSKEVGDRLGIADNAVNQRKHHIKRKLREYLQL